MPFRVGPWEIILVLVVITIVLVLVRILKKPPQDGQG